eukprot:TRINITY_DN6052_c1_g1_i1.p1 TRINITY_DN6052_c1_g1~~TRINITY_DN6052_c1_g1_i1.p1  ORF type:complete len:163 (-),score=47.13 TRINITY_DN6052_c1_g1_i1:28-516(-)
MATYSLPITSFCICFILAVVWVDLIFDCAAPEYGTIDQVPIAYGRAIAYYQGQRKAVGPIKFVLPILILVSFIPIIYSLFKGHSKFLNFSSLLLTILSVGLFSIKVSPLQLELLKDRVEIEANLPFIIQSLFDWHVIIGLLLSLVFVLQIFANRVTSKVKTV